MIKTIHYELFRPISFEAELFARCLLLVEIHSLENALITCCKICSLLVLEVACCKKWLVTRCKIRSLPVAEVVRCKKSLVTRCKIRSLLVAEVAHCKNLLVVRNHSLLVAKLDCYLLHKVTKKSQLNLVMDDKI